MLKEGITSKLLPQAVGPYSPALKVGDFIYISGQLPIDKEGNLVNDDIVLQTKQCLDNMKHLLEEMELDFNYVVKTTVYLSDLNDFSLFNKTYDEYFKEPYPARSLVEVNKLVKDAKVEIEAFVIDTRTIDLLCENEENCKANNCCGIE